MKNNQKHLDPEQVQELMNLGVEVKPLKSKTEFQIGEEVQFGLLTFECLEDIFDIDTYWMEHCDRCGIYQTLPSLDECMAVVGSCCKSNRTDHKNVIFKLKE